MKIYEVNEIVEYMENIYPSKPQSNYKSIAKKYIDICVMESLRGYNESSQSGRIDFRISTLNENIVNRFKGNKYWLPILRNNFPFFYTIQKGWKTSSVSVLSKVKPVFGRYELLGHYLNTDYAHLLDTLYPVDSGYVIRTPIDIENLIKFRDNYVELTSDPKYKQGIPKLCKWLFQAKSILDLAQAEGGVLSQSYSVKPSGRTYTSGINLQTTSSEVREAALGKCYKYDLRTSAYAHMLQKIVDKYPDFNVKSSYINEYITNKKYIRKMLAKCLTHTLAEDEFKEKLIKKTLAAIGFGANISNPGSSVSDIIYHKADRKALLADDWMKGLLSEIQLYRVIMKMSYPRAKKEFADALSKNGPITLNKWCALEYQLTESSIINYITNQLGSDNILLQVHDALYMSVKCDIVDLNWMAHKISPMMNFESEEISSINHNKRIINFSFQLEAEHKQRIAQEEERALETT